MNAFKNLESVVHSALIPFLPPKLVKMCSHFFISQAVLDEAFKDSCELQDLNALKYFTKLVTSSVIDQGLSIAAKNGHLPVVEFLVASGAGVTTGYGDVALWGAARNGHLQVVEFLVDPRRGSAVTANNNNALQWAAAQSGDTLQLLNSWSIPDGDRPSQLMTAFAALYKNRSN